MDLKNLLKEIDNVKDVIDEMRPLPVNFLKQLKEYYRIGLTYSSNALEGNTLTESETKVVLEDGITVGGKPLKDIFEAIGHSKAFEYMMELSQSDDLSENDIKKMHKYFYTQIDEERAGEYRKEKVVISGTSFIPPSFSKVPDEMQKYVKELKNIKLTMHPVLYASFAHRELVRIHPFIDGNGRTARLIMNLILFRYSYPITVIPPILRSEYIAFLRVAHETKDYRKFDQFIAERVYEAVREFKRLVIN